MKSITVISLCMVLISSSVSAEDKLVFSSKLDYPLEMPRFQILQEAYELIGIKIEREEYPAERGIMLANEGKTDGDIGRRGNVNQSYPNLEIVPIALAYSKSLAFTKLPNIPFKSWESLRPYRIGVVIGHKNMEKMTKGMKVFKSSSAKQLFKMLDIGRVDIIAINEVLGRTTIQELQLKNIKVLQPPLINKPIYHFLNQKHKALIPEITKALQIMENNGRLEAINQQFMSRF